jgi:hypothetical protein
MSQEQKEQNECRDCREQPIFREQTIFMEQAICREQHHNILIDRIYRNILSGSVTMDRIDWSLLTPNV